MIAVTAFFAPPEQKIRKKNFDIFRANLGIPLIALEWSPSGHFHIRGNECDHLIQLESGDNLWQKEALLNIGIRKAQELGYDKVALLDADIVFLDPEWYEKVSEALNKHDVVQCFREVRYLSQREGIEFSPRQEIAREPVQLIAPSLASIYNSGQEKMFATSTSEKQPLSSLGTNMLGNPGLATAFNLRNSSLKLYDANIVGAGDLVVFAAATGQLSELFRARSFSDGHIEDILAWAQNNHLCNNGIGHCDLPVVHLWHGDAKSRGYLKRHEVLSSNNYRPSVDITHNISGLIEFTAVGQRLVDPVGAYLSSRKEG